MLTLGHVCDIVRIGGDIMYKGYTKEMGRKHSAYRRKRMKEQPWYRLFYNAQTRCSPSHTRSKFYYHRGIRCEIRPEEVKVLWDRDGADKMDKPSLDRIDTNKSYSFNNCRIIELEENRKHWIYKPCRHCGKRPIDPPTEVCIFEKEEDVVPPTRTPKPHEE